ncbi:UNVERIFIED_CONTAM: hypothetical protein FKN15_057140 [Acipenser sinensis]
MCGSLSRHCGHLAGMPRPPYTGPCSQVAALPGTVVCLVPFSAPPEAADVTSWESDVACAPPSSHCVPPEAADVAVPVHSLTPLPAIPRSRSPACATVAQGKPSGSLLAGSRSLPGSAGGTNPPSSPPVEEGED